MSESQQTIKKEVSIKGVGLHTGNKVNIKFKPASMNLGINFVRIDLPDKPVIKADLTNLLDYNRSPRRSSIGVGNAEVHTIEHIMAVFAGLSIDNIFVEIDNNEVPGLDGSGATFLDILSEAGLEEQNAARKYFLIKEPVWAEEEGASLVIVPALDYRISYTLSYNHCLLGDQYFDAVVNPDTFKSSIASARTFCLEEESEMLRAQGLGRGANYDNTLVVGKKGIIKNRLRFDDEFVRHKVLDLIGDLYLLGVPIKGHVIALKSGHPLNIKLLKKVYQQKERYNTAAIKAVSEFKYTEGQMLDAEAIMRILPHRYPFLFVDRVVSLVPGKSVTGLKNVTINDNFFNGHFPGRPVMPGVLIVEAMAQIGGVMMLASEDNKGKLAYFLAADNVRFRKTVLPGDQLVLEAEAIKIKSRTGQVRAKAFVGGKVVAEANLMFALVD
ncbi:MAG: bifunctional UDP-3-O-[3-hydroxymyristoyl] N-acetylglucosamine deacetylase/3-hydroxyacyl-ACP dehydratase [Candidatus Omnitrophota bacterium]|nr:bifunctional UDP-3-O-[3-hydroxymyristoyl] N-acetylglucosamine deacetylase/3-hydroxyacyl-ACP dehydratase [Candidatus Omnitrophota bacterium]